MPTLRCQVHGWEYDADGRTRKIPDACSFRPLEAGTASLTCLRTETVGPLVFVSLNAAAPPLAEFLGEGHAMAAELNDEWALSWSYDQTLEANWKLSIENVLENYHNAAIHPRTFAITPPEEACRHRVFERGTIYDEPPNPEHPLQWQGRLLERWLGQPLGGYRHLHVFPHVALGRMGPLRWVHCALPTGPGRARIVFRFFHYRGGPSHWRARCAAPLLRRWARSFFSAVLKEDEVALLALQRGLESPTLPRGGLISTREERIFYFQRFVLEQTQGEPLADTAEAAVATPPEACVCADHASPSRS
jgi:phenylpropionate dioxygenase-like ring-hydroxylating dioxygenase large terminal subunit